MVLCCQCCSLEWPEMDEQQQTDEQCLKLLLVDDFYGDYTLNQCIGDQNPSGKSPPTLFRCFFIDNIGFEPRKPELFSSCFPRSGEFLSTLLDFSIRIWPQMHFFTLKDWKGTQFGPGNWKWLWCMWRNNCSPSFLLQFPVPVLILWSELSAKYNDAKCDSWKHYVLLHFFTNAIFRATYLDPLGKSLCWVQRSRRWWWGDFAWTPWPTTPLPTVSWSHVISLGDC